MTIQEIIEKHLRDNGFGGLCNPDIKCGCGLDDFMPCDFDVRDCEPAYCVPCDCPECDGHHFQVKNEDFHHHEPEE